MSEQRTEKDAMSHALQVFGDAINGLDHDAQAQFMQMTATLCICAMRGTFGEEFCRGFLTTALADLEQPATTFVRRTQ